MSMKGMQMSMAQPPPVYPEDQPPLDAGDRGYFPGVEGGDPAAGRMMYGASCARCHGAAAQGGSSGPDLSDMPAHFTPSHIAWHIKQHNALTPPMQITDKEAADLTAFLETLGVK
jgi:mono/diheme cytochrome c family protein